MAIELPWHSEVLDRIDALVGSERLPHALALTSQPGWGCAELAAAAAARLLAIEPGSAQATAAAMQALAHPDFRWIEPDGAEIKVDQVRAIVEFAIRTMHIGPRKVVVIAAAHRMNRQAANALLKILEEPPAHTHLILSTDAWSRLLPTVRSRCHRFDVANDHVKARRWLVEQNVEPSDVEYAELGFAPLLALEVATQPNLQSWLDSIDADTCAHRVQEVVDTDLVVWLARWYRRLSLHLQGQALSALQAEDRAVLDFADLILSARRQLVVSNAANGRVLLEQLVSGWCRLRQAS